MLREMSSSQMTEWIAFYQEFPPQEAEDFRAALITSAVYNAAPRGKGSNKVYQPSDFMPKKKTEKLTPDQLLDKVRQANEQLGGRDLRKR